MFVNNKTEVLDKVQSQWNDWIQQEINFKQINEHDIQVLTPFVDYFGDGIVFNIIENAENNFTLTDKGYTLWNMKMNNIDLSQRGSTRQRLLMWYLKSFGFSLKNENITKDNVKMNNLSQSIIDLAQLLLIISDLGATNRANTKGLFFDDVKKYFEDKENNFFYTTNTIALGRTQQQYTFEYNFTPELGVNKLAKLYNTLSKNTMEAIIGIYSDTSDYFNENFKDSSFNVLINGIDPKEEQFASGLEEHNIDVIDFNDKDLVKQTFGKTAT